MTAAVAKSPHYVANWMLCEVEAALANCGREPISRAFVAAGEVAWDDCCGMLVVAPERTFRYLEFPSDNGGLELCYRGDLAVDLVVLLVRCIPTVDDRGRAPSAKSLDDAYQALLEDGAVVWGAVANCTLPEEWERANVGQVYTGALGGCIGVETRVTIGLPQRAWSMR